MVETPKTADDFDNMSDEDFMNLDPDAYGGDVPEGETSLTNEELHAENQSPDSDEEKDPDSQSEAGEGLDPDQSPTGDPNADASGSNNDPANANEIQGEEKDPEAQGGTGIESMAEAGNADPEGTPAPKSGEQPKADSKKEGEKTPEPDAKRDDKPVKAGKFTLPKDMTPDQANAALAFASVVMAPFKADGKDFAVRTPEDAIKLMQQGVNYSRRMQELKPMKAMNRMLQDNGLADETKLNFAIDLLKGDKTAITKLLKDNNLDPMDLDVEKETGYQAKNYAGDPQDNAFRDALDNAKTTPDGQALISEVHNSWDDASKMKLREKPSILGNLIELRQSGVYQQVADELAYQRSMGYLTDAPYLEAFDQVGEAMKNAGVLKVNGNPQPAPTANSMGQLQDNTQTQVQPVAQGARKAPAPKNAAPNPHLSSTPPSKQPPAQVQPVTDDFGSMSDEDFLKMPPPS